MCTQEFQLQKDTANETERVSPSSIIDNFLKNRNRHIFTSHWYFQMEALLAKLRMHLQRDKDTTLFTQVILPTCSAGPLSPQSQILQLIKEDNRAFDCLC